MLITARKRANVFVEPCGAILSNCKGIGELRCRRL